MTFEWVTFGYLVERRVNNAHEVSTAHVPELQNKDGKQRKGDSHDVNNIVAVTRFVVLDEW